VTLGQPAVPGQISNAWGVPIDFPCTITNVPSGQTARLEAIKATFEDPSGLLRNSVWLSFRQLDTGHEQFWLDSYLYRRFASKTVSFHATLYITLQAPAKWPLPDGRVTALPGGRRCTIAASDQVRRVFCIAPFHAPWDSIDSRPPDKDGHNGGEELVARSFSPWPAEFAFSPVFTDNSECHGDCTIRFRQEEPLAWFRRDIHITIHLPPMPKSSIRGGVE
jgi:hypothetical protein